MLWRYEFVSMMPEISTSFARETIKLRWVPTGIGAFLGCKEYIKEYIGFSAFWCDRDTYTYLDSPFSMLASDLRDIWLAEKEKRHEKSMA